MTKARELAELGGSVIVHDTRIDFDRQMQVRGLTDSAPVSYTHLTLPTIVSV